MTTNDPPLPKTPSELAREAVALAAVASPPPWTTDDGNIFSQPLSDKRTEIIMRRLEGALLPHPDRGLNEPLGFIAKAPQSCPNFENDERFIAHAGTHYADIAHALLAAEERAARLEGALRVARYGFQHIPETAYTRAHVKSIDAVLVSAEADAPIDDELLDSLKRSTADLLAATNTTLGSARGNK